ncbi:MAG: iron-sulfur cluster assembly scaffold protein [Thermoplasmatota archaeon]
MRYKGQVYNFEVASNDHSYLVRGFAVHNCTAAIATSSVLTEMVKGKTIDEALKITRDDVANELGGLPAVKMHCSNLAADALREAIKDYRSKQKK